MQKTSCVRRLVWDPFLTIRSSYVQICNGNYVAAALISYFESWHNNKLLDLDEFKRAESKYPSGRQAPHLWQYHSMKTLEKGLMGMAKRSLIDTAKAQLESMGIISVGRNPDPKFAFDATTFYLFHPDQVNHLLAFVENSRRDPFAEIDEPECAENSKSESAENGEAIPKSTTTTPPGNGSAAGGGGHVNGSDKRPKKKPAKKAPGAEPDKDRQRWIDRYEEHVKEHNNGIAHRWDGAQLGPQGINGIREHLVKVSTKMEGKSDDDCGYGAWCYILDHWLELGDDWLQGQFDLTVILKKITDILNRLKNGGTKTNRGANSTGVKSGTSAARVDAIKAY